MVAGDLLEDLGLTFDIANDGQIAIEKIQQHPNYDLVLMDVQMPVMDGLSATRALREMGYNEIVVCGLSANAMSRDEETIFHPM